VRDAAHARYAIGFAEGELDRCRPRAIVLVCLGVLGLILGAAFGSGALFAASGGPLGAGIADLSTPRRLRQSISANQRMMV
jgi:hypothetical protein